MGLGQVTGGGGGGAPGDSDGLYGRKRGQSSWGVGGGAEAKP